MIDRNRIYNNYKILFIRSWHRLKAMSKNVNITD